MITLFGVLWIVLIILCLPKIENMIVITTVAATIQCSNVVVLGGVGIGPQIITSIFFIIRTLTTKKIKIKKNKQDWNIGKLSLLLFGVVFVSSAYNGVVENIIARLLQLLIYILCAIMMYVVSYSVEEEDIYQIIRKIIIFMIVFGFVQILSTSGVLPRVWLLEQIFFNETGKHIYYYTKGGYSRVLGTFMEPSYFAGFAVGAFYYFLSLKEKRKNNWLIMGLLSLEIILTFASTAYGAIVIVGIIYILLSNEKKFKLRMLFFAAIAFIAFYVLFYDVLDRVIFSKINIANDSYKIRHWANLAAYDLFKKSPIIGNGYKQSRASSVIYTILAENGIVGLAAYILLNGSIIINGFMLKLKKHMSSYHLGLLLALMATVVTQVLAVPDLDICTYWMWMNLLMIQLGKESRNSLVSIDRGKVKI